MVYFVIFVSHGPVSVCGTNGGSDDLFGHAIVVSVTPVGRWSHVVSQRSDEPPVWFRLVREVLTCVFLGARLGFMDQFRGIAALTRY